ncbi:hypothetical protein IJ531_06935, partial [bacterium]|nr:hypothetical protein [bacterium]
VSSAIKIPVQAPVQSVAAVNTVIQAPKPELQNTAPKVEIQSNIEPEKEVQNTPQIQPEISPAVSQSPVMSENVDIALLWTKIINAITSLPTKAFYTGVAKLVDISNQKITLGFLNENTLTQAKTKLTQLQTAIDIVSAGYSVEFIKIDSNTKTLDVKPKIAPVQKTQYREPAQNVQTQPVSNVAPVSSSIEHSEENEEEKTQQSRQYSPEVQEMIEQYSGKIIE